MKLLRSTLTNSLLISALLVPAIADHSYADGMTGGYSGSPAACCFTWTGFYFGVNGGGAWTDSHTIRFTGTDTGTGGFGSEIADGTTPGQARLDWSPSFTGGAQLGYNVQFGSAVAGVEADVQWLNAYANVVAVSSNPLRPTITTSADREMNMLATLRARFGMTPWEIIDPRHRRACNRRHDFAHLVKLSRLQSVARRHQLLGHNSCRLGLWRRL